ncbi:family 43 glycosylhydrolase [Cohnella zeiphila]|uniref:Family 43 glycosylhydrolase n=1 Tax=Cohnella zeiphila TaxID=2761120 RepID=A0A7X0SIV0_9BACL|nr:family 43 glycosylhydrolase [Cohnella zeiphila]MBB6730691.1 family 43 glycosylhydrolase [Cohnella zeiphila]
MRNSGIPADFIKSASSNPIVTTLFAADPSAHVWEDGKVYIYASRDMDPARGCDLMDRYHVYSSEDMANWVDEGEILRSDDVSWGRPEGGFMWAPDCAYKNGTYYFYYPHPSGSNWNDSWKIGVATSRHPATGFVDKGFIEGLGGFAMIDPCVFVDEDGRAYMYYGGGGKCEGGELGDDMMSIRGGMRPMEGLEDFHEAAWIFKRNGLYYLTYADNLDNNNRMRYAVSRHPLGPWDYKGIFLEPTGCSTTHGSVAEFKGRWYLFYHNQDISGQGNLRSMCVDELHFEDDGSIRTVVQTKEGVRSTGSAPVPAADAVTYAPVSGSSAGGLAEAGAYAQFERIDGGRGGRAALYIRYATDERLGKLRLTVNGADESLLNFPSGGGASDFSGRASVTVRLQPGTDNVVRLTGGQGDVRLESLTVVLLDD